MQSENSFNGVIAINKPKDFTSFDVVAVMRGILKQKKIGHTGTLDPMATGVLPLMLGKATRTLSLLEDTDKEYIADFRLGITTDTQDITGRVLSQTISNVTEDQVQKKLTVFKGNIEQIPPMFSAVKVNGERLYSLARSGIEVERKPRKITIYDIKLLSFDAEKQEGQLFISCGSGTYVRTICHDLGQALGSGGIMTKLCRTKACSFGLEDCMEIDEVKARIADESIKKKLIGMDKLFTKYPELYISKAQAIRFQNGGTLSVSRLRGIKAVKGEDIFRLYCREFFLGLGVADEQAENIKVFKNLSTVKIQ